MVELDWKPSDREQQTNETYIRPLPHVNTIHYSILLHPLSHTAYTSTNTHNTKESGIYILSLIQYHTYTPTNITHTYTQRRTPTHSHISSISYEPAVLVTSTYPVYPTQTHSITPGSSQTCLSVTHMSIWELKDQRSTYAHKCIKHEVSHAMLCENLQSAPETFGLLLVQWHVKVDFCDIITLTEQSDTHTDWE